MQFIFESTASRKEQEDKLPQKIREINKGGTQINSPTNNERIETQ